MKTIMQSSKFNLIPLKDVHPLPRGGSRSSNYAAISSLNSITSQGNGVLFFFTEPVEIPKNLSPMDFNFWLLANCVSFMSVNVSVDISYKDNMVYTLTQVASMPYAYGFETTEVGGIRYHNGAVVGSQLIASFIGFPFVYIHCGDRTVVAATSGSTTFAQNGNALPTGVNNTAEPSSMLIRSCEYAINACKASGISNWIGCQTAYWTGTGGTGYGSYIVNSVFRLRRYETVNCLYIRKEKIGSLEYLGRMRFELHFWNGSAWQLIFTVDEAVANAAHRNLMFTFNPVTARSFRLRSGHLVSGQTNANLGTTDFVLGNTDLDYEVGSVQGEIVDCILWSNNESKIRNSVGQMFETNDFQPALKLNVGASEGNLVQLQNTVFNETKSKVSPELIKAEFTLDLSSF